MTMSSIHFLILLLLFAIVVYGFKSITYSTSITMLHKKLITELYFIALLTALWDTFR